MKGAWRMAIRRDDPALAKALAAGNKLMLDVTATPQSAHQWLQVGVAMVGDGFEFKALPHQPVEMDNQKHTFTFDLSDLKLPENPAHFTLWIVTNSEDGGTPGEIYLSNLRVQ